MKVSKKSKLITLTVMLAILLTVGIGLIVSLVDKDDIKPQPEHPTESEVETTVPLSMGEQIQEGMEVKYSRNELTSLSHIGRFSGEFVNYKGKTVLYYDQKLKDLQTGDTILELPESVFSDYVWGVYVDNEDQIYTISSKEAPGTLLFNHYSPIGERVGEPVQLKDNSVKWFTGKDGEDDNFVRLWYFAVDDKHIYLTNE